MSQYKRRTFIINPKFQLKLAFLLCFLTFISTSFYPLTIYDVMNGLIENYPDKAQVLSQSKSQLLGVLLLLQVGFLGLMFVAFIFISHKIAGPMFKLKSALKDFRDTNKFSDIYFRNGDYFQDVADEVNQTISGFVDQREQDFKYLDEVNSYLANLSFVLPDDKKEVLKKAQEKLTEIQGRY